jgi:HEPN domain-containing protein
MQSDAARWLQFANEDLQMAKLAMAEGLTNQVCFHSQQCCEKLLKGVIASSGELVPRTHKMVDLLVQLNHQLPFPLEDRLRLLDRFYIPTRYPEALLGSIESGTPTQDDAMEAMQTAADCTVWVMQILRR